MYVNINNSAFILTDMATPTKYPTHQLGFSSGENQSYDQPIETQDFGKDQDKDHTNK